MSTVYRIRVGGHLDDRWSTWFDGFEIRREQDGTSVLVGPVCDQAALHGLIARIRDLGLPLLEVAPATVNDDHSARRRHRPLMSW